MAAIVVGPPPVDPGLVRFRSYVVNRHGATHVTTEDVKKAFETEMQKPYGRELLLSKIDAHDAQQKPRYQLWENDAVEVSGIWSSDATKLVLHELRSDVIKKNVTAHFSGTHFNVHDKTIITGKLYYDKTAALDGTKLAIISTKKNECSGKIEVKIDWMDGTQDEHYIASFICDDFPQSFPHEYVDPSSLWSEC